MTEFGLNAEVEPKVCLQFYASCALHGRRLTALEPLLRALPFDGHFPEATVTDSPVPRVLKFVSRLIFEPFDDVQRPKVR